MALEDVDPPVSALAVVPLGFVTGAFWASIFFAWLTLKFEPGKRTRHARIYLAASIAVAVGMTTWVLAIPWLD